jgi:capsid protein
MSMPVEVLLMKFGSNYSASRAALLLFWRVALRWRQEMASDCLNPIYEMWLSGEIAAGRIEAPGWSDPRLRAAWLANNWVGSPMPNIDPSKTAKATKMQVEMGLTTLGRAARELNGSDGKANRAKIAREFAEIPPSPFGKAESDGDNGNPTKKDDDDDD